MFGQLWPYLCHNRSDISWANIRRGSLKAVTRLVNHVASRTNKAQGCGVNENKWRTLYQIPADVCYFYRGLENSKSRRRWCVIKNSTGKLWGRLWFRFWKTGLLRLSNRRYALEIWGERRQRINVCADHVQKVNWCCGDRETTQLDEQRIGSLDGWAWRKSIQKANKRRIKREYEERKCVSSYGSQQQRCFE